ncbi:hypothetical protein HPB50_003425 [Hyalomma asiaticum]|uniref:Uncharacterized protein n=1 Tax=Hyalomma asiaticum TaxID=266040 RepID=A0ACB7SR23_HYAAI|nr:hypothetical protein HPB50_003425 [Hyalomma asiaticum]
MRAKLSPFLDADGVLRVGGRLSFLDSTQHLKQPVILPTEHHLLTLLQRRHRWLAVRRDGWWTPDSGGEATEEAGLEEERQLEETWSTLERFVGAEPQSMCIEDFVGSDDSTGTMAELTDMEIAAEATAERLNKDTAEVDPTSADVAPLPTSAEAVELRWPLYVATVAQ